MIIHGVRGHFRTFYLLDHGLGAGDYISRGEDPIYGGLAFFYCHFSPFLLPFSLCPLFFTYFLRIFHTSQIEGISKLRDNNQKRSHTVSCHIYG